MDYTTLLSGLAIVLSLVGLLMTGRKDSRSDAAGVAMMSAKLDAVMTGVDDIRVELRSTRETILDHGERLARVEARAASNTHRLDTLESRRAHPPDVVRNG